MRYRCLQCFCDFDELEATVMSETVGEFHGTPASETYYVCPECGSDQLEEWEHDDET